MEMESASVFSSYHLMANSPEGWGKQLRIAVAAFDVFAESDKGGLSQQGELYRCSCTVFKEEEEKEKRRNTTLGRVAEEPGR